ncbi:MAG: excinuclease ABC subunit UvrC, partial [Desulfobacterales bacterium]
MDRPNAAMNVSTITDDRRLEIERKLVGVTSEPGVYLMKGADENIIYIGKARNLKKRLTAYFKNSGRPDTKTGALVDKIATFETIITETEKEALILESNLIKRYKPRYNVVLKDDKRYPSLRLDPRETYPSFTVVRKIQKDGALYFGPYSSANAVRSTLKLINRIFQLRKCKGPSLPKRSRPCLNHQLARCLGACVHEVSPTTYGEIVDQARMFLEGRNQELLKQLKKNMDIASSELQFERAARIRDQIIAVEKVMERQDVVSPKLEDQDVIGLAQKGDLFLLVVLFIRKGYLIGTRDYLFNQKGVMPAEVMEAFLKQYYSREAFIPRRILISEPIDDLLPIKDWISDLAEKKVTIHHPLRG